MLFSQLNDLYKAFINIKIYGPIKASSDQKRREVLKKVKELKLGNNFVKTNMFLS